MTDNPVDASTKAAVDTILAITGLPVVEEEYERLLREYPLLRQRTAALRIPEIRYSEPALIYSATASR